MEERELLESVEDLERELEELRVGKLNFAIQQFKTRLQAEHSKQRSSFEGELTAQMNQSLGVIRKQAGDRKGKLDKLGEEIKKQRNTYVLLLQDLESKKVEISNAYEETVQGLRVYKDKQQVEWKKKAQEFLMKFKLS